MGYNEVTFLSDRVCGICGFAHSTAYTTSVENAMGIQVPERAQMIRAILLEVERLHSHLLNLGLACHFTGFDSASSPASSMGTCASAARSSDSACSAAAIDE